jgi:carboxyl-terminal processing protease
MNGLVSGDLAAELDDVRSRGVEYLLLDLRNLADLGPRDVVEAASLFSKGPLLRLRDRAGRLIETVSIDGAAGEAWAGSIATLVNGATAGSAEALASLLHAERGGIVLGETTYGLGAEVKLFELEDGSGLLVSSALWETAAGDVWNEKGVEPDEVVNGKGADYPEISSDQLDKALDVLERRLRDAGEEAEAA